MALFLIGFIFLGMMPTVFNLATDEGIWDEVQDSRAIFLRDNALNIFYISGIMSMFATIIWMFNASQSKGASTVYG